MNQFTRDSLVQFSDLLKAAEDSIVEISVPIDNGVEFECGWDSAISRFYLELTRMTMTPIQASEIKQLALTLKRNK